MDFAFDDIYLSFYDTPMTSTVRAAALTNFAPVCREIGLDPLAALRSVGLDPRDLRDPDRRLPAAQVHRLLDHAAATSGCATLGLRMGATRGLADFGALGLLMAHQPTPRAALEVTARHRRLLNEALAVSLEEAGGLAMVRATFVEASSEAGAQSEDLAAAVLLRMVRALLGAAWRPITVTLIHAAPRDATLYSRLLRAPVRFDGEFTGLVLDSADLDRPNTAGDAALAGHARRLVELMPDGGADNTAQETRKALHRLLPVGRGTLDETAMALGLHARALQRRLTSTGDGFAAILDDVRRELAARYLADPTLSATQVAQRLGFGQLSSFSRWFAAAFGASPRQWRAGLRRGSTTADRPRPDSRREG